MTAPTASSAPMEGGGAYNRHARLPEGGARAGLAQLAQAVANVPLTSAKQPIVIADYGASQGKNSLVPLRLAIEAFRARVGQTRPILVYHEDLPGNDFSALFAILNADAASYVGDDPNVFPCAVGRSFYGAVLPPEHVNIGWSSYAVIWASRVPLLIPGHISTLRASGVIRAAFDRQGAEDWEMFLSCRCVELCPGGRLVVVVPAVGDDGLTGFEAIMDCANDTLIELVAEGTISADEYRRMVLPVWPRHRRELLAPFACAGRFRGLTVEHCETLPLPDLAWAEYQQNSNRERLAGVHALFFRSIFTPTLALALDSSDAERSLIFCNRLEQGMRRRIIAAPSPMHSLVATIVLAKDAS